MGEGRARGGGADSLRRIRAPSALQIPKCTKPELEDTSRASDLNGRETKAQGGEGAFRGHTVVDAQLILGHFSLLCGSDSLFSAWQLLSCCSN